GIRFMITDTMAFCTNCGTQLSDGARFCVNCGQPITGGAPAGAVVPLPEPLDYNIEGHNLQIARVHLKPGQEIFAEAGKMVYKSVNVAWETRMSGDTLGQKLLGALKRRLMGESLMMTYFRAQMAGEVGFAGHYPGKIHVFDLAPGQSMLVQRDGFLFAQASVQLDIALVRKLGAGLLGGEGFILEKLTGPGPVFVHAGGDFVEFNLTAGEQIQVQTGHLVAFEPTVTYDIQMVGSIRTAIFGGEGIFLATLTGPGKVVLQSLTLERLRHELSPGTHGGDEHRPIDALGGGVGGVIGSMFRSDD
ncbi:MAG TPA: TIGR00266 family protein, partial [Bryobacteraceae bacterium]